jgi:hypothetical protein
LTTTQPEREQASSDELLGELAHELSVLVRRDLELSAAEQGHQVRDVGVEIAAALAAGLAVTLALAAASWAAAAALALAMPLWSAALIVAAFWGVLAVLLVRLDHPRRLYQRLKEETSDQALGSAQRARDEAAEQIKITAGRLTEAVAREAAERELRAGLSAAERVAGAAEDDAEYAVKELIAALLGSGRAGITLLERLAGRHQEPPAP